MDKKIRFQKGTFITIPNKNKLRGMTVYAQVLYLWLNNYSNGDGVCFPSKKKLSEDCNIAISTITKAIKELEDSGLISVTRRREGKECLSNIYTINLVEDDELIEDIDEENDIETPSSPEEVVPSGRVGLPRTTASNSIHLTQRRLIIEKKEKKPIEEEKENIELCSFGFPLPAGWSEENLGLADDGSPQVFLRDEMGNKVVDKIVKELKKAYRIKLINSSPAPEEKENSENNIFKQCIQVLKAVNPMAETLYQRKIERDILKTMLKTMELNDLISWLKVLPKTNQDKRFPKIYNLSQFAQHFAWLQEEWFKKPIR